MKKSNLYWIGLSDLMISMFFIMLVIAMVQIQINVDERNENEKINQENIKFKKKIKILESQALVLKEEKKVIETVQKNIEKLKEKDDLFQYDSIFKRYTLKFDVEFYRDGNEIENSDIKDYKETRSKLIQTGEELFKIVENLDKLKKENDSYKDISYMIVISGSSSITGDKDENYKLSYLRAYNLYKFWNDKLGVNFDDKKYHNLIELQIAGNGTGGVGRVEVRQGKVYTEKNQRFIINIIPKLGSLNEKG
ncbi:MAG: outer membrane protein OmpA-like peptidoglycan-associated protein [Psychroserpens sp.]|jgi:outer membrane protein OmpA-like peptidoglycan-associated protein